MAVRSATGSPFDMNPVVAAMMNGDASLALLTLLRLRHLQTLVITAGVELVRAQAADEGLLVTSTVPSARITLPARRLVEIIDERPLNVLEVLAGDHESLQYKMFPR